MKFIATESIREGEQITIQRFEMIGHERRAYIRPSMIKGFDIVHGIALSDADRGDEVQVDPKGRELDPHKLDEKHKVANVMNKLAAVVKGQSTDCIECGEHFTRLEQVGACVYARPCNHRQYQGSVPK